ncbi:MAG: metal-dependent hydrolase [Salinirussus sp.]
MHREGHYGAALLAYAPIGFLTLLAGGRQLALLGAAAALALAMLPDQDQRIPGLSHRGPTHTVWFALLVGVVVGALGAAVGARPAGTGFWSLATVAAAGFGFVVGTVTITSHIAADALTPMGVTPLAPFDDRHVTYDLATADNPLANYGLLVLGGGVSLGLLALWAAL